MHGKHSGGNSASFWISTLFLNNICSEALNLLLGTSDDSKWHPKGPWTFLGKRVFWASPFPTYPNKIQLCWLCVHPNKIKLCWLCVRLPINSNGVSVIIYMYRLFLTSFMRVRTCMRPCVHARARVQRVWCCLFAFLGPLGPIRGPLGGCRHLTTYLTFSKKHIHRKRGRREREREREKDCTSFK